MKLNKKQPHHKSIDGDVDLYVSWRSKAIIAGTPAEYTPSRRRKVAAQKRIDIRFERREGKHQARLAEFLESQECCIQQGTPIAREVRL